jgi:hypothetical protein
MAWYGMRVTAAAALGVEYRFRRPAKQNWTQWWRRFKSAATLISDIWQCLSSPVTIVRDRQLSSILGFETINLPKKQRLAMRFRRICIRQSRLDEL